MGAEAGDLAPLGPGAAGRWPVLTSRPFGVAVEVAVAVAVAGFWTTWARRITVNPLHRIGQVSGLAALGLHFAVGGALLVAAVLAANAVPRVNPRMTARWAAAAAAGLLGGLMAGGIVVALHGTAWPLFANLGDAGVLEHLAAAKGAGGSSTVYPPLFVDLLRWWSDAFHVSAPAALRSLQIIGTALTAPVAYLAWRLLLSPLWALTVGVVSALSLAEAYKPYEPLVLIVLVPLLAAFVRWVRHDQAGTWRRRIIGSALFGASLGVLFLTYSGWFVWIAPGAGLLVLIVAPWRTRPRETVATLVCAGAAFALIAGTYVLSVLTHLNAARDTYQYPDSLTDPAFIAMWRTSFPGTIATWPPPGELGGVGLFTVLLTVGLGLALALGRSRTLVLAMVAFMASAWLVRMWIASRMFATGVVAFWPRTGFVIFYCLVALVGIAVWLAAARVRSRFPASNLSVRSALLPVIAACLLLFASTGSAFADHYMPGPNGTAGVLARASHLVRLSNGQCPTYGQASGLCGHWQVKTPTPR